MGCFTFCGSVLLCLICLCYSVCLVVSVSHGACAGLALLCHVG